MTSSSSESAFNRAAQSSRYRATLPESLSGLLLVVVLLLLVVVVVVVVVV